jgi:PAS domain S-box-containing protein
MLGTEEMMPHSDNHKVMRRTTVDIFNEHQYDLHKRTDHMFAILMVFQCVGGVVAAYLISPKAWIGTTSHTHIHVWIAMLLGTAISSLPIFLAITRPGRISTRYTIAVGQMLMGGLLIHLTGGRIETHFHIFGSLAFLSFYRDWRVLVPATFIVAADHFLRGFFWPQSVYGVLTAGNWRWVEHAGWVLFEDIFLLIAIKRSVGEMWNIAARTSASEHLNLNLESHVAERTAQLATANLELENTVAEGRRAAESLKQSEEWLTAIFESSRDGIMVEENEVIVYANKPYALLFEYSEPKELMGKHVSFVEGDDANQRMLDGKKRQRGEPAPSAYEFKGKRKDGTLVNIEASVSTFTAVGKTYIVTVARDITERKRGENALRESDDRHRQLFESNPLPSWVHDLETLRFLMVNQAAVLQYGYTREEFLTMTIKDIRPPEDISALPDNIAGITLDGDDFLSGQWRHLKKDKTTIYVEISSHAMICDGKRAELVIANDITRRKQAEESLRESETRFRMVSENLGEGIFITDLDDQILYVNSRMAELVGYAREEVMGKPGYRLLLPQEEWPGFLQRNKDRGGCISERSELHVKRKDGTWIWLEVNAAPYHNAAGEIVGTLAANTDITERKHADAVLRESEKRYRLLFENNPHPMWVFDIETLGFLAVNEAAIQHYGYSREEFLTLTIKDLRSAEDLPGLLQNLPPASQTLVELSGVRHQKKDGTDLDVEITAHAISFDGRPARLVLSHDITERKLLEGQVRQSQKMEAVGKLAGGVAHDFNNLLTVINGYSEICMRRLAPEDPVYRNIQEINKAGCRAAALTRQLLAFSRKQILQPKVIDLNSVVVETNKMLQRLIGEDINLMMGLGADLEKVKADPNQIEQVLLNLAVNARDAMPRGGKLTIETVNVYLGEEYAQSHVPIPPGKYVLLAMSDTGDGMDAQTQARIFEPFFTTKEMGKGTGLGLATVYGIVKQSGGYIWVYSEVGCGSTFKIYLPSLEVAAETTNEIAESPELFKGIETILLVEDEELVRNLTAEILRESGYAVLEAKDGSEALMLANEHDGNIPLMLTDVVMPQMSGRQLAEQFAIIRKDMKVLFMSGYTDDAIVLHGVLDEGTPFIGKPFSSTDLGRKIREVLDSTVKVLAY